MLLPHLGKGRELSRAALLRAKLRLQTGDVAGAVDDITVALIMARHLGSSPVLVSLLVDDAIEREATELLAEHFAALDGAALDRLANSLTALPATPSLADCLAAEGRALAGWFEQKVQAKDEKLKDPKAGGQILEAIGRDAAVDWPVNEEWAKRMQPATGSLTVANLRASIARLKKDYAECAQIARSQTYVEREELAKRFLEELSKAGAAKTPADRKRLFSTLMCFLSVGLIDREAQRDIRRELLSLAILVQRRGPDSLKTAGRFGKGEVEYRATTGGFELHTTTCRPISQKCSEWGWPKSDANRSPQVRRPVDSPGYR